MIKVPVSRASHFFAAPGRQKLEAHKQLSCCRCSEQCGFLFSACLSYAVAVLFASTVVARRQLIVGAVTSNLVVVLVLVLPDAVSIITCVVAGLGTIVVEEHHRNHLVGSIILLVYFML